MRGYSVVYTFLNKVGAMDCFTILKNMTTIGVALSSWINSLLKSLKDFYMPQTILNINLVLLAFL